MSFWGYGFNHRSKKLQSRLRFGMFQLIAMFTLPSLTVYFFGNPTVTKWFATNIIPVYVPPQADNNDNFKGNNNSN